MKTISKCAYCKDPIEDFQELKVGGRRIPLHKGCLSIVAKEIK